MLDDVVLVILAARAIMLEDALDDRIVRTHSEEVFHLPLFPPRMSRFASGSIGFRIERNSARSRIARAYIAAARYLASHSSLP